MDVSIIIVNFNSGEYLAENLTALTEQPLDGLEIEYLVVDCNSPLDQGAFMEEARARGARIIALDHNPGYAGGCNRGLTASSGHIVFFLNADVVAKGDCLGPLIAYLKQHSEAGLVEPRTFLDRGCAFIIPEMKELTRLQLFTEGLARTSGRLARHLSLRRVRKTLPMWRAKDPIFLNTRSGAFMGMRRDVIIGLGGLDEGFPLFYEDSDLFRRMRNTGFRLVLHPGAEAVHFAHSSIATVWNEAMAKLQRSRERYIRKHLGNGTLLVNRLWERAIRLSNRLFTPGVQSGMEDLGARKEAPVLEWPGSPGPYLLEVALDPFFHLAAGHFNEGNNHCFSEETWDSLRAAVYHFRVLNLENLEELGRWRLQKL